LLSSAVGPRGRVLVVDWDSSAAWAETEGARGQVLAAVASPVRLPVAPESVDVAVSLFGLAHCGDVRGALGELKRVVRPRTGRLAIVLWAGAEGAPHEVAATTALEQKTSVRSAFIREALTTAETLRADDHGLPTVRLRDVVRFDSADHLWRALVDERPVVASELDGVPPDALSAARRAFAGLIGRYCQHDGTIRIPVEAVMLTGGQP
jgi:SAM-dependent methyltransferase